MLITSLDNLKVKKYVKLKNKKYRDIEKMYLVETNHLVEEALNHQVLVDLLVLENEQVSYNFNYTYVTKEIMKKLSNLETIPKVIGVVKMLEPSNNLGNSILLLDDIQDPGNLGTIIRSSVAFNVSTIVLGLNCVDLYNEKVIRSTQGMLFKINIMRADLKEIIANLKKDNYLILGTNVKDGVDVKNIKVNKYALIMGNEGKGVKEELLALCDKNLYIKMNNNCESLNVSVATSILLYELNGDKMIYLGKYVNTHGIKGEIRIKSNFKYKDKAFKPGNIIKIANQEFTITSYRVHKEYDMLTLKDINNINQIIDLKGENVYIDKKYLNLNDDEYLDEDLLNLDLYMGNNYLGKVEKVEYLTKNKKLLIVSKRYIPFELVKEIDFLNKKIIIEEVSGL